MLPADFIALVAPWARESFTASGVPASVTIAQAILESAWGESELARKARALFGVKYGTKWSEATSPYVDGSYSRESPEYLNGAWTTRVSLFCAYPDWRASVLDHGLFLRRPVYAGAFPAASADAFARAIHAAGYATDPGYSDKLIALMRTHNLYRFDLEETPPMNILSRATWGAAAPSKPLVSFDNARLTHIVAHWPGDSRDLAGLDSGSLLRAWQRYHMTVRGWKDIGYNYAVDQAGRVYEARGWHVGGHVLGAQNSIAVGVLFMVGNTEQPTDAMLQAGHELRAWIEERAGRELACVGHSDWANKLCPGPYVLPWVRRGMPAPASTVVLPEPVKEAEPLAAVTPLRPSKVGEVRNAPDWPLDNGCHRHGTRAYFGPKSGPARSVSGYYSHRDDLKAWQERMAYRGWKITGDGLYGPETEKVATAFQREKGLAADGLVGASTWAAAWTTPIS